jgi:phage gp36-like protein
MFLTDNDFKVVIGDNALKVISQTSPENLTLAINEAIEEISGYLRPAFNTDAVFAAQGSDRNNLIVMYTVDIAIYHLIASQPQKFGADVRKERYERAIKWLEGVQAGKIVPDLPTPDADSDGNPPFGTYFTSQRKLRHNW